MLIFHATQKPFRHYRRNPLWQANYHDHIIRNENEYRAIVEYIDQNPAKWDADNVHQ